MRSGRSHYLSLSCRRSKRRPVMGGYTHIVINECLSLAKGTHRLTLCYPGCATCPRIRTGSGSGSQPGVSQVSRDAMLVPLTDEELDLASRLFPDALDHIRVQTLFSDGYTSVVDQPALPVDGGLSLEEWLWCPHILVALSTDIQWCDAAYHWLHHAVLICS